MSTHPLIETEARQYLQSRGISIPEYRLATSPQEAVDHAKALGLPVVLKIVSKEIVHKSDVGGVRVNLRTAEEVAGAYESILSSVSERVPGAKIDGVLVARHIEDALEVIIGAMVDKQFGPVIMFGLGGIFVEVFKDVIFGIAPLSMPEAESMVRDIQGYPLIKGVRGQSGKNEPALTNLLVQVSDLMMNDDDLVEVDLNPVLVTVEDAYIADARIICKGLKAAEG
jgi:acyl-CoA synthetase (NDP forming)